MNEQRETRTPVMLFYSYAPEDTDLCDQLEKHLSLLQTKQLINTWHNRQVAPGADWASAIDLHLKTAGIILLLISSDFLASKYLYSSEMQYALKRAKARETIVIPVILRPCDWMDAPFASLQHLPHNGQAVTQWENRDAAYLDIVKGIREAIEGFPPSTKKTYPLQPNSSSTPVFLKQRPYELTRPISPPPVLSEIGGKPEDPLRSVPWAGFGRASLDPKGKRKLMIILPTIGLLILVFLSISLLTYFIRFLHQ